MDEPDLMTWIEAEIEDLERTGWEGYKGFVHEAESKKRAWENQLKSDVWMLEMLKDAERK